MKKWAKLSDDGVYRYWLGRRWNHGPCDVWVMLNPSTANHLVDDRTISRCIGFSQRWGSGSLVVVNRFALRATDPAELVGHPDPVGPENDHAMQLVVDGIDDHGGRIIAAWGSHPMAAQQELPPLLQGVQLHSLGTTKSGAPRHPLYVRGDTELTLWSS